MHAGVGGYHTQAHHPKLAVGLLMGQGGKTAVILDVQLGGLLCVCGGGGVGVL